MLPSDTVRHPIKCQITFYHFYALDAIIAHAEISVDAGDLRGEVRKFVEVYIFRLKSQRLQGQHENGVMFPDMGIPGIFDIHIVDSNMSVIKIIGVLPLHITVLKADTIGYLDMGFCP